MTDAHAVFQFPPHDHLFLGKDHDRAERRTWAVIILCSVMMIAEILAVLCSARWPLLPTDCTCRPMPGRCCWPRWLIAMPANMPTIATSPSVPASSADLAGYSSAIVLAMIALLIAYDAVRNSMRRCFPP